VLEGGHGDLNRFSPEAHVALFPEEREFKFADGAPGLVDGSIGFDEIPKVIERVLGETETGKLESINDVLAEDGRAREVARERITELGHGPVLKPVSAGRTQG